MNGVKLDGVQCVKDLGVSIVAKFKFSQLCKYAASKANRMLGFGNSISPSRIKILYNSTTLY